MVAEEFRPVPTIPQVYDNDGAAAERKRVRNMTNVGLEVEDKVNELNRLFPEEYTSDIYAAHAENTWMTYNPYQYQDKTVNGVRSRHISLRERKVIFLFYIIRRKAFHWTSLHTLWR